MASLILSDDNAYDTHLRQQPDGPVVLPHASTQVTFITKDKGTGEGNPIVLVTFPVMLPDGTRAHAQATMTVREFQMVARGIEARHGDLLT